MPTKGQEYIIDYKALESGIYEFDYQIDNEFFSTFDEPMVHEGDARAHVTMRVSLAGLDIKLTITGTLKVECDRCLEEFDMPIDANYDLIVKFGDKTTPLDEADDVITIGAEDDFLDLRQHIYEYTILSLPARRVHPDAPDGTPGCNPEMLSHILIAEDDDEEEYYDDEEEYEGDDEEEEEYFEDKPLTDGEDEEEYAEDEEGDENADPFAGQEMETIEQKLSRDPRWKKIKAKLNNI